MTLTLVPNKSSYPKKCTSEVKYESSVTYQTIKKLWPFFLRGAGEERPKGQTDRAKATYAADVSIQREGGGMKIINKKCKWLLCQTYSFWSSF